MTTMYKPKSITIIGRRWFRRSAGNTYCTAEILIDGECVHKTPEQYGYGDFYMQAAQEWLNEAGYIKTDRTTALWRYCEENGIKLHYSASDVSRERDL